MCGLCFNIYCGGGPEIAWRKCAVLLSQPNHFRVHFSLSLRIVFRFFSSAHAALLLFILNFSLFVTHIRQQVFDILLACVRCCDSHLRSFHWQTQCKPHREKNFANIFLSANIFLHCMSVCVRFRNCTFPIA